MKKYIAILTQKDSGCDYTIGCGITTVNFEAENIKSAASKLIDIVRDNYTTEEHRLSKINFHEIIETFEVDLDKWYKIIDEEKAEQIKEQEVLNELALLAHLKKKYEK